jgi:hypothetical protein
MKQDATVVRRGVQKYPVLAAAALVFIPLALFAFYRSDAIDLQQDELDKFQAESKRYRSNIVNSVQLQQQVDYLAEARAAIGKRTFRSESLPLNLQYFYKLESEVGVEYLDLRPGGRPATSPKTGDPAAYFPLNYSVSVRGTFAQVIAYLRCLEQGAYFCRINSASLLGSGSSVTLNLDLDLLAIQ